MQKRGVNHIYLRHIFRLFFGHFEKNSRLKKLEPKKKLKQIFKKLKQIIQKPNNLPTKNRFFFAKKKVPKFICFAQKLTQT